MRKTFLLLMTVCLLQTIVFAQVGIGTISPNTNAALDITSVDKGLIIPRVTTAKRLLMGNNAGMLVFDTNDNKYWVNNGTGWTRIVSLPPAVGNGDLLYWNGTDWAVLPVGVKGQSLRVCDNGLTWSACTPIVTTAEPNNIGANAAISGGLVVNDGGATVTAVGVCYATTQSPTLSNSFTTNIPVAGAFVSNMLGLTPGTTYYVKAYATNSQGTSYGNQQMFTTTTSQGFSLPAGEGPTVFDFDGVGPILPLGFTVRTGATASSLGTEVAYNNTNNYHWKTTGSGCRSYASGTLSSSLDSAAQAAATNRSVGYRQTGTAGTGGDPGLAFVLKLANTTNHFWFNLDFRLQSLDAASLRTVTWAVEYAIGETPTSFIPLTTTGTMTTGNSTFASNLVSANFGNALDDINQTVWIRIVALTNSTGSGTRPVTAIDNFTLSYN